MTNSPSVSYQSSSDQFGFCQKRQRPSCSRRQAPPRTSATPAEVKWAKLLSSSSSSISRNSATVIACSVHRRVHALLAFDLTAHIVRGAKGKGRQLTSVGSWLL